MLARAREAVAGDRGSVTVELVIATPLLLLALLTIIQFALWSHATAFAAQDPRSVPAGLLLQTSNQMIDLEATRWATFWSHIPQSIIYVNVLIAMLVATLLGYGFGLIGRRHLISTLMLAVSISSVLVVIVDLDRPWQGYIRVSQQPMIDLQKQMEDAR